MALEMAWVDPAWAAHWLKRRQWRKQRKKAPALAFALRSWRPPGAEVASRGPRRSPSGAKKRGLRAVLEVQPTSSGLRGASASPWSLKAQQPILGTLGEGDNTSSMPSVPLLSGGLGGNASSRTGAQIPKGQGRSQSCACPSQASMAPRAAAPPRVARGPTPRTEEAAWAAMALTFLLVLLTLATLCTRLHRNFRRSESIYWGPTADSQDTVAAVLKRRLLLAPRRVKRSRRRPLLQPAPDSGPDGESSD
ncbi:tumor protein p53-inducible protein 13 isoform X2 [Perognathus longimembris pacificus]|nr:tumor protein p53-inducible protein 13 isoform X2 [Perognathus longimembris pacificus]